jgi:hypothetical protein
MIRYVKNPASRKTKSVITVDGQQYQAKYIGKGQYSKVYRVGDRVVYYTRGDCGKEVLAQFQYDRMAHLPEIIRHENITIHPGHPWYVFSSPYYRDVTSRDTSAYKIMNKVIEWYRVFHRGDNRFEGIELMQDIVIRFAKESDVPRSVVKALQEIVDVASNCGYGVRFDLHKKNFGVNEYGTLIFRDPIYVRE